MLKRANSSQKDNDQNIYKKRLLSFEINVPIVIAVIGLLYLGYAGHQENMKNSRKLNELLVKYEKTLDTAIANDANSLKNYRKNVEKVLADLSPQEKAILETALRLSQQEAD
ncbi:hypothetical protein [Thalassotalea fusca]